MTGAVAYGWDVGGRRTSVAATGTNAPTLTYLYDDAGRPTFVQRNGSPLAEATYDAAGRLATVAHTNPGLVAGSTTTYAYDAADRVTGLTTVQGATTIGDFGYNYARSGQVVQATEAIGATTRTVGYSYDGLGRVVGSTVGFGGGGTTTYAYGYDLAGNRTSASVNGVTTQSRSYDAADQVVGWTYDNADNLLTDGTQTYTWDALGRLATSTVSGATSAYGYTGDGDLAVQAAGGTTTRYALDTEGGLAEWLGAVATTGGATLSTWYARGLGAELSRETSGGSANLTWYLGDRLGSVRAEYGASGTPGLRVDYDPFGQPEVAAGLGTPGDYGFTGEPQDSATGLVQLRARWYAPTTGTFLGRDPFAGVAETPQTFNPYAYTHNDPVNGLDPTGMFRTDALAAEATTSAATGTLDAAPQRAMDEANAAMLAWCSEQSGLAWPKSPPWPVRVAACIAGGVQAGARVALGVAIITKAPIAVPLAFGVGAIYGCAMGQGAAIAVGAWASEFSPSASSPPPSPPPGNTTTGSGATLTPTAPGSIVQIFIDRAMYPESAKHIEEAWRRTPPMPRILQVDRKGQYTRRDVSLAGELACKDRTPPLPGYDRDEYPQAIFFENTRNPYGRADVKCIPTSDNKGSGSSVGNQLTHPRRPSSGPRVADGDWVEIVIK